MVVLIIGILAAVALPQYETAVGKSRAAQVMALLNTVTQAQESYFLANGQYSPDFTALDVDLPQGTDTPCRGGGTACKRIGGFELEIYVSSGTPISVEATNADITLVKYWEPTRQQAYGRSTCLVRTEKGRRICIALGGRETALTGYYKLE